MSHLKNPLFSDQHHQIVCDKQTAVSTVCLYFLVTQFCFNTLETGLAHQALRMCTPWDLTAPLVTKDNRCVVLLYLFYGSPYRISLTLQCFSACLVLSHRKIPQERKLHADRCEKESILGR